MLLVRTQWLCLPMREMLLAEARWGVFQDAES